MPKYIYISDKKKTYFFPSVGVVRLEKGMEVEEKVYNACSFELRDKRFEVIPDEPKAEVKDEPKAEVKDEPKNSKKK